MAANKKDGGSAFPNQQTDFTRRDGMSLRDYFAGQAMQSICGKLTEADVEKFSITIARKMISEGAYTIADAMLQEREK